MSFYMILPSNCCPDTQPDNNASKFIMDWENSKRLDGTWQVALTEVTFYSKPTSLKKGSKIVALSNVQFYEVFEFNFEPNEHAFFTFKRVDGNLDNFTSILCSISEDRTKVQLTIKTQKNNFNIESNIKLPGFTNQDYVDKVTTEWIPITFFEKLEKNWKIQITYKDVFRESCSVYIVEDNIQFESSEAFVKYFSEKCHFFEYIKLLNSTIDFRIKSKYTKLIFDKDLAKIFGYDQNEFYPIIGYHALEKPILKEGIDSVYIYCSLVEPIQLGNTQVPLLRSVWLNNVVDEIIYLRLDNPMYLNVNASTFNNIEINIRNDVGELIPFKYGSKSSLTLHFRKLE